MSEDAGVRLGQNLRSRSLALLCVSAVVAKKHTLFAYYEYAMKNMCLYWNRNRVATNMMNF